jgi:hypothetical protein
MPRLLVFFAASLALVAQYPGQYPYPRSPYPGGGGVGGVGSHSRP